MIYLKELNKKNVTNSYVSWMNDLEVQQYTEQKYKKHTINDVLKFVEEKKKSKNEFLYGIFLKKNNEHIGNIKLGPINRMHKHADISYFIGNKKMWGRGYATKAIKKIISIAKKKNIKKLQAGCYEINKESIKILLKNKFKLEGILKKQIVFKNKRYDSFLFGLVL